MSGIAVLAACILLSAAASVFLKAGVSALSGPLSMALIAGNPMLWIGGVFYGAAFLGYIYVLRLVPLSVAQPAITAGVSAVTALVAVMFYKEQMHIINWLGLSVICLGIFLLFWGRG